MFRGKYFDLKHPQNFWKLSVTKNVYIYKYYIYIYLINIYIYIYILSGINSPLLNPAIQRMGNTPNILSPRCREQDKSQPHFILYCKLSKITLGYISELINLNYFFTIPFKFSLKTIIIRFFPIPHF